MIFDPAGLHQPVTRRRESSRIVAPGTNTNPGPDEVDEVDPVQPPLPVQPKADSSPPRVITVKMPDWV